MLESKHTLYARSDTANIRDEEMGNDKLVEQLFGTDTLQYLDRKHRGGVSGAKGTVYESFFAVYQVASLVPESLQADSNIHVETQLKEFVDDIVISDYNNEIRKHYQLKNSTSISWTAGRHPIKDDFRMQKELNNCLGLRSTTTTLVCADSTQIPNLSLQTPTEISSHSQVENFGYAETLNATLQIEPKLADAIKNLCAFADTDKVERLGILILGEWSGNCSQISDVSELWEPVLQHEPNYVKSDKELTIPVTLTNILMQIDGFSYTIDTGYLVWNVHHWHMEGKFPYLIDSKQFVELSSKIVKASPTQIEDLENLLV